jgi:multiple antibiotic resistance protein
MDQFYESVLVIAAKLFAIMDPFAVLPIILNYYENLISSNKKVSWNYLSNKIMTAVFGLLLIFSLIGKPLLDFLGLSPISLYIAGGIILVALGIDTLGGFGSLKFTSQSLEEVVITPIATPLIVGPGTMTALISFSINYSLLEIVIGAIIAGISTYLVLLIGPLLIRVLGRTGTVAVGRFTAIIIAAFGVQLVLQGITLFMSSH